MKKRKLGSTGMEVGPISFGAFKIGRNEKIKYAREYALPGEEEAGQLLNGVLDLGINLIDTAPAYGVSEERIGRHISHRRREFILSTKVGETFENGKSTYEFSKESITHSIHRSLLRLKTDVLDFVFIHSDGNDLRVLYDTDAVATLQLFQKQGMIRHIGLSGKTVEGARAAMDWAQALMVEFHPNDLSHEPVIGEADERGIAIFVKKPLASGELAARVAIPWLLGNENVSTLVIGGLRLEHVRENLGITEERNG